MSPCVYVFVCACTVCLCNVCVWGVCDHVCVQRQLRREGWAESITISISVDQGESLCNPGLSPASHTPQLSLIQPSSSLPEPGAGATEAEFEWGDVCVFWGGRGGGQLAQCASGDKTPPRNHRATTGLGKIQR